LLGKRLPFFPREARIKDRICNPGEGDGRPFLFDLIFGNFTPFLSSFFLATPTDSPFFSRGEGLYSPGRPLAISFARKGTPFFFSRALAQLFSPSPLGILEILVVGRPPAFDFSQAPLFVSPRKTSRPLCSPLGTWPHFFR